MDLSNQVVQVGLIAAVAGLLGAIIGSLIGAGASWLVARSARQGAKEARLHEVLAVTGEELVTKGSRHIQNVSVQLRARQARAEDNPRDTGGLPNLQSTDDLEDLCNTLYLVARQPTADAGTAFYNGLVAFVASYRFNTSEHVIDGVIKALTPNELSQFEADKLKVIGLKTAFMDEVRSELGQARLQAK